MPRHVFQCRARAGGAGFQRVAHRAQMVRHRAAAAADDPHAGIPRQHGIFRHQRGRAVIVDMAVVILGDAGIALGDQGPDGAGRGKAQDRAHQVAGPHPAVGAKRDGRVGQLFHHRGHGGRGDAHHRPACGVEAHRAAPGHAGQGRRLGRRAIFLGRADRLDPKDIGAAFLQPLGLFVEDLDRRGMGQSAHRFEDLARGADRSRDDHRAARGIGGLAPQFRADPVELAHATLGIVQPQPRRVAAEGVGQKQIRPRRHGPVIQLADRRGLVGVPQFRRVTRGKAHIEQVRPRGTVGQHPVAVGKQAGKRVGHGGGPSTGRVQGAAVPCPGPASNFIFSNRSCVRPHVAGRVGRWPAGPVFCRARG